MHALESDLQNLTVLYETSRWEEGLDLSHALLQKHTH